MFKRREQIKLQRIAGRPTEAALKQFSDAAKRDRSTKTNYFWTRTADNQDFMLSVKYADTADGMMVFRMYLGAGPDAREQWFYLTDDLLLIYTMIVKGMGEDLVNAVKVDASVTVKMKTLPKEKFEQTPEQTFDGAHNKVPIDELKQLYQDVNLNGELAVVHITNVLQSLSMGKLSGRLKIESRNRGTVEIFIEDGNPVHARGSNGEGLESMLHTIGWTEGKFQFEPLLKTDIKSIQTPLSAIIMQGTHLVDNTNYVLRIGIRNDTVLVRKNPQLTEAEFDAMMSKGEPVENSILKSFYLQVDGRKSLSEINNLLQLPRSKWVHVVANMVRCNVLTVQAEQSSDTTSAAVAPKQIDSSMIDLFVRNITRTDTGLLTYTAFLYLLQHDLAVREGTDRLLSIVIFEAQSSRQSTFIAKNPSPPANVEVIRLVNEIKGAATTFAHYERADLVLILPDTKPQTAAALCERIRTSISADANLRSLDLAFGISSVPKDASNIGTLLATAEFAKSQARTSTNQVVVYTAT